MNIPREVNKWVAVSYCHDAYNGHQAIYEHLKDFSRIQLHGHTDALLRRRIREHLGQFDWPPPPPPKCKECGRTL